MYWLCECFVVRSMERPQANATQQQKTIKTGRKRANEKDRPLPLAGLQSCALFNPTVPLHRAPESKRARPEVAPSTSRSVAQSPSSSHPPTQVPSALRTALTTAMSTSCTSSRSAGSASERPPATPSPVLTPLSTTPATLDRSLFKMQHGLCDWSHGPLIDVFRTGVPLNCVLLEQHFPGLDIFRFVENVRVVHSSVQVKAAWDQGRVTMTYDKVARLHTTINALLTSAVAWQLCE